MFWIIVSVVEFVIIVSTIWVAKDFEEYWASCIMYLKNENHKLKHENGELKAFIFANLKEVYVKEKKDGNSEKM